MSKTYLITRVRSVLEGITLKADSESKAVEAARKTLKKDWKVLNDKRRKNYISKEVCTR